MEREAFVFYRDWLDAIEDIEDSDKLAMLLAIAKYALDREEPKLPKQLNVAFKMMRATIDRDVEKWEETRIKRSEAGKMANAARAKKNASKREQTQANASKREQTQANASKREQTQANAAVNVNVNVNDNVGVNPQKRAPAHAGMYEENDQDSEIVKEYKRYMKWCIGQGSWYANQENTQRLQDYQYVELRHTYTKEQIKNATQELEGRQDFMDARRYRSHFAALSAFLRKYDKTTT